MTLSELLTETIRHVRSGEGDLEIEVETPKGYPPLESLEIVEHQPGVLTAVFLTA
jgi:hypothetical protein